MGGRDPLTAGASDGLATRIDHVLVANHSSAAVMITWVTDAPTLGCVRYGVTRELGASACEDGADRDVHHVILTGLSPRTRYYFEVASGGVVDDDDGELYTFETTDVGAGRPGAITGYVISAETGTPLAEVLVSGISIDEDGGSHPIACRTDIDGRWVLSLGNLKDRASSGVLAYREGDGMELTFEGGNRGRGAATVTLSGASPQVSGVFELRPPEGDPDATPSHFYLAANYPNPFAKQTTIRFGLPEEAPVRADRLQRAGAGGRVLVRWDAPGGSPSDRLGWTKRRRSSRRLRSLLLPIEVREVWSGAKDVPVQVVPVERQRYRCAMKTSGMIGPATALTVVVCISTAASSAIAAISDVQVSNLTSSSATVTWTTDGVTDGCVNYGTTTSLGSMACDPRPDDDVHAVTLSGLSAETTYFFEVTSGGETDDDGGAFYTLVTPEVGSGTPYVIFGHIVLSDGTTAAVETIVTAEISTAGGLSSLLSELTDASGAWSINLGNLKSAADGSVLVYAPGDTMYIAALGAADGSASGTTTVSGTSPQSAGTLVLSGLLAVSESGDAPSPVVAFRVPNPFRSTRPLEYELGRSARVTLSVVDAMGRAVRTLDDGWRGRGSHRVAWDGRDDRRVPLASGVYVLVLALPGHGISTGRTVLIR